MSSHVLSLMQVRRRARVARNCGCRPPVGAVTRLDHHGRGERDRPALRTVDPPSLRGDSAGDADDPLLWHLLRPGRTTIGDRFESRGGFPVALQPARRFVRYPGPLRHGSAPLLDDDTSTLADRRRGRQPAHYQPGRPLHRSFPDRPGDHRSGRRSARCGRHPGGQQSRTGCRPGKSRRHAPPGPSPSGRPSGLPRTAAAIAVSDLLSACAFGTPVALDRCQQSAEQPGPEQRRGNILGPAAERQPSTAVLSAISGIVCEFPTGTAGKRQRRTAEEATVEVAETAFRAHSRRDGNAIAIQVPIAPALFCAYHFATCVAELTHGIP